MRASWASMKIEPHPAQASNIHRWIMVDLFFFCSEILSLETPTGHFGRTAHPSSALQLCSKSTTWDPAGAEGSTLIWRVGSQAVLSFCHKSHKRSKGPKRGWSPSDWEDFLSRFYDVSWLYCKPVLAVPCLISGGWHLLDDHAWARTTCCIFFDSVKNWAVSCPRFACDSQLLQWLRLRHCYILSIVIYCYHVLRIPPNTNPGQRR